jgi:hypothetical protein
LIRVVELETTFPWGVVSDARDQDVDPDIPGVLFPVVSADSPNVQVSPQQIGIWHRYGNQITPIDGHAGPLLGGVFRRAFLYPLAETGFPQGERLQGGCLTRIVGPDENHGLAQLDLNVVKAFEVFDSQTSKHCDDSTSLQA